MWLQLPPTSWPKQPDCLVETYTEEVKETCLVMTVEVQQPIITLTHYTTYVQLQRVNAWMLFFSIIAISPATEVVN